MDPLAWDRRPCLLQRDIGPAPPYLAGAEAGERMGELQQCRGSAAGDGWVGAAGGARPPVDTVWPACARLLCSQRAPPGRGPGRSVPYISVKISMNKLTFLKISAL